MYTEFSKLPDNARVWIYQSNREFTSEETENISKSAEQFIDNWTRHGDQLKGSFTIKYNRFLIIAVDENFANVSGCSIDASVRFVKGLENELQIDLLNKLNIAFKTGENVNSVPLQEFKAFIQAHKIGKDTIVFNNLINSKKEFENNWEVPAVKSWHQRLF